MTTARFPYWSARPFAAKGWPTAAFRAEASAASASYDQTGAVTAHAFSAGR